MGGRGRPRVMFAQLCAPQRRDSRRSQGCLLGRVGGVVAPGALARRRHNVITASRMSAPPVAAVGSC
eukprot:2659972-Pleurochrysis_carterae.AAC.1